MVVIFRERSGARLAAIVELYAEGQLQVFMRKTFPLEQAADAHREVEKGHGRGKVVLDVS
ncbi:zinc-binding dehydrogenase [Brevibacillus borstelensis]|uniref:zinc-binding dehydrogenase n=1 Tax=Brevibacillus borstelensis TaxID=45462 RepID=UPI0009D92B4F|nr:zinc-binding dehydrogenase [Brevibacillus borstelensis]MBE5396983.1 zinc-binding dehydrogenase [Brevibacillus borstelensis]NOU56698.1 zinc-binding dehydrogenase [Brevibacillus borstelensis]RNB63456.1 hypothetical protein EDM54_09005 [Brevibacillus borstelensis]WNF08505.1 zinc-binding dehydrogenase [Brevibacillus borstelensis]